MYSVRIDSLLINVKVIYYVYTRYQIMIELYLSCFKNYLSHRAVFFAHAMSDYQHLWAGTMFINNWSWCQLFSSDTSK